MKWNTAKHTFILLICFMLIYTLVFPHEIACHTRKAIDLCYGSVLPSLFTFIVLSKLLSRFISKTSFSGLLNKTSYRMFNIPALLLPSCIFGLFCGAPAMSYSIKSIYEKKLCSKEEAQRAIILSNNCSFSFILGFVSLAFTDRSASLIILFSNLFSTFTVYSLLFRGKRTVTYTQHTKTTSKDEKISNVITEGVSDAAASAVSLCGFIVFFYTLSFIVKRHLETFLLSTGFSTNTCRTVSALICSVFEMTSGAVSAFEIEGYARIPVLCFCTSLLGISVFCQVSGVFSGSGICISQFIKAKILSAFLSSAISVTVLFFVPADIPANLSFGGNNMRGFSVYHLLYVFLATAFCFIGVYVLSYVDKRHKN